MHNMIMISHAAQQTVLVSLAHAVLSVQEGWITGGAGAGDVVMTAIEQDAETSHQNGEEGQEEGVPKEEEGEGSLDGSGDEGLAIVDDDGDVSAAVGIDVLNDTASPTVTDLLSHVLAKETPEATKLRVHFLSLYASMTHRTSRSGSMKTSSSSSSSSRLQLSRDDRQQLAEIAVKRAFSECPNLSILVLNLLDRPLYALHKHSCLSIGVPVAPMLAKPTKQITDVLKRLSGLAFTVRDESRPAAVAAYLYFILSALLLLYSITIATAVSHHNCHYSIRSVLSLIDNMVLTPSLLLAAPVWL